MSVLVVDTSVVIKWYLDEPETENALQLLNGNWELHSPAYLLVELDSVLLKRYRRDEISSTEAERIRDAMRETPIVLHSNDPLIDSAFLLALQTRCTNYDTLFVILAEILDTAVITSDRKLVNSLKNTPISNRVKLVSELE